jgi:hypothetical protein
MKHPGFGGERGPGFASPNPVYGRSNYSPIWGAKASQGIHIAWAVT